LKLIVLLLCSSVFASTGALNTGAYLSVLKDKNIAVVVNQTSVHSNVHLIDFLLAKDIKITKIFALEHGVRGQIDAGSDVGDTIDAETGIPIISLYGKHKQPQRKDLESVDIILFDIQDLGVRFYTYITSLKFILNACSEFDKTCIVLDRGNPFVNTVSGPVLDMSLSSFVGSLPIPITYGLTIGELALMMKGEKWVKTPLKLIVVPIKNWKRIESKALPIKPSPNLPDEKSIELYPSLAAFEGTNISVGRGTKSPFTVLGHPLIKKPFSFTPVSIPGMSSSPLHENEKCFGFDLSKEKVDGFSLKYLARVMKLRNDMVTHPSFFNKLIGVEYVLTDLRNGLPIDKIESKWKSSLDKFNIKRQRYIIYE
jgi:uncharacterized protein YbbC (DUF1343 family)